MDEVELHQSAAAWCDKHKPTGGVRAKCLVCAIEELSAALSRISYLCEEPNEYEVSSFDVLQDESAVVEQVRRLRAERDARGGL